MAGIRMATRVERRGAIGTTSVGVSKHGHPGVQTAGGNLGVRPLPPGYGSVTCFMALSFLGSILLLAQSGIDEATLAFQQGKMAEAEQKLRPVLEANPSDLRALVLMGAVLDTELRYNDADVYYQRALKIAPGSAQLLNNAANHYLA